VIGALEAINKKNGGFTLEDQDILTALGAQAAIAIENTRLFQQSDLIAELVHELRTPLASLGTAVHLMQRPQIPAEQQGKFITIIQDEIARLSDLTSTFLDLSRLESGRVQFHPELFDLKPVVTNCLEIMQGRIAEKNLELLVEIPNDPLPLKADKDKIKQVILNLLSNATKYNYPGGKIHLTIYRTEAEISLAVQDTGPGISEANLKRLFEKFYRVPGTEKMAQGTGLGLLICKRIIEAHGGRISVQSQVGQGTTFSIHLPLSGNRG